MATANFTIKPEQGWVAVTTAGVSFLRIRSSTHNHPFYVTSGSSAPAATVLGFKVDCNDFWVDVPTTDIFYVRTTQNQPTGNTISVFSLPTAP
jgi:hypothetical protein